MPSHPWLQSLDTVAICPKCGQPALHRSRSRTSFEKLMRKYSFKRQFRCHACEWRGWLDETRLRYPAPPMTEAAPVRDPRDVIPTFDLNGDIPPVSPPTESARPAPFPGVETEQPRRESPHPGSTPGTPDSDRPHQDEFHPPDFYHEDRPADASYDVPVEDYRRHKKRSGYDCPKCGSPSLFRSRHRGVMEMIRKNMSDKRPFRCHKCGWRGWLKKV